MNGFLEFVMRLGLAGPFLLGVADSSFLFLPFGNDLLLLILIARNHAAAWEYVPLAALGSVLGIFLIDIVSRKSGEAGLEKLSSPKRIAYLKKKMSEHAGYAVAIACLTPPPFPFTLVIASASALQYSRRKLLLVAFVSRLVRYALVAALAVHFKNQVLSIVESRAFFWTVVGFTLTCGVASVYSVVGWIRRGRRMRR